MTTKTAAGASNELFDQAMEMFETALQTGVKIQEESTRRLTEMMTRFGPPQEWQKKTQSMFNEALQTTQKNVEEAIRVMNESAKRNVDLLQKAFEAGQAENTGEAQAKARDVWEATMGAVRANAQAIVQANTRVLESWAELGKKLNGTMVNGNE
jgi:polyhydroxyalkanoate synthesis regulator protein